MAFVAFPIIDLPYIAQKNVLAQMLQIDVLKLSFMSSRLHQTAKDLRYAALKVEFRAGTCPMDSGGFEVIVRTSCTDSRRLTFRLSQKVAVKAIKCEMNGRKLPFKQSGKLFDFKIDKSLENNMKIYDDLIHHLKDIYKTIDSSILYTDLNLFQTSIFYNAGFFSKMYLKNIILTEEQAKIVLEELNIDDLTFDKTKIATTNGPIKAHLKHRRIDLGSAYWLAIDSMYDIESEQLDIIGSNLDLIQLVEFMKCWLEGKIENVRQFKINIPRGLLQQDIFSTHRAELFEHLAALDVTVVKTNKGKVTKVFERRDGKRVQITIDGRFEFKVL